MSYSDKNKIFFGLLHYIFTEQSNVNWAFKTSLINYTGINENVSQRKYKNESISNDIIKYVKDIKPYHVQFDHYIEKFTAKDDIANVRANDTLYPEINVRYDAVSVKPDIEDYLYTQGTINIIQNSNEHKTSFDDSKLSLGTKFYNYDDKIIYKLIKENNKRIWIFDSYPIEGSLYYFKKEDNIKIYESRYNQYAEQDIVDMYDLSYDELRYFENTTMANRLFLYKTHDLDLIKDYLNAHFKGITIDGGNFDIDRIGYDSFLYDKKPYEYPVKTNTYYLADMKFKPILIGTDVIILDYSQQFSKDDFHLYSNNPLHPEILDYSINDENIITIYENIIENEEITANLNNTPIEYFKAYDFSKSDDENYKRIFYNVEHTSEHNEMGESYVLPIPDSSFVINNIIVNIEDEDDYRFTTNIYKIEDNNIIIPKKLYTYKDKIESINDLPISNMTIGDIYKLNDNTYYLWTGHNWSILDKSIIKYFNKHAVDDVWNSISLDINWKIYISISDQSLIYDKIYTWEDVYGISNNNYIENWKSYYKNMGLVQNLDGGEFLDPYYSENRPSELTVSYPQDTLTIYVSKANAIANDYEGKIDFSAKQIYNFDYKNLHERFNTVKSAKLLNDFNIGDTEILFNKDVFEDPYIINNVKYPGKLLIDSELIEYFEKEINDDNTVTLKKLRRGTNGSFIHNRIISKNTIGYAYRNPKSYELDAVRSYYFVKNINMKKFTINGNVPLTNLIEVFKTNNITLLSKIDNETTSFIISNNTIQLPTYDENNNLIKKGYMFINNDKIEFETIAQNEDGTYTISNFNNPYNKEYDYGTQIPSKEFIKLSKDDYTINFEGFNNEYDTEISKSISYITLNSNPNIGECIIIENRNKNVFD